MSINKIIEEQKTNIFKNSNEKYIGSTGDLYINSTRAINILNDTIKQILEAEVERLKGMKKEIPESIMIDDGIGIVDIVKAFKVKEQGYNQSIDEQISHLTNEMINLK